MANEEEQESIEGLELESSDSNSELEPQGTTEDSEDIQDTDNSDQTSDEKEAAEDSESLPPIQGKLSKKKKIILISAAVSGLIIIITLILFLFGVFDSEPPKVEEVEPQTNKKMQMLPPKKKYTFSVKDINKKRLNRKLALLTKDEIIEIDEPKEVAIKEELPMMVSEDKTKTDTSIKTTPMTDVKEEMSVKVEEAIINDNKMQKITEKVPLVMEEEVKNVVSSDSLNQEDKNETVVNITPQEEITHKEDVAIETVTKDNEMMQDIIENEVIGDLSKDSTMPNDVSVDTQASSTTMDSEEETISEQIAIETNNPDNLMESKRQEPLHSMNTEPETVEDTEVMQKSFLLFAQVATIKTKLYLSFLQKINKIDKRISVCRNDVNHIEIFVGPFSSEEERSLTLKKINNSLVNDAFAIDFTQNEFDKRCKL